MRYITDRKRAEGLGAGRKGTEHHWKMLVSSILMVVLMPLLIITFGCALGRSYEGVLAYFARPVPAIIMALGLIVGLNHIKMEIEEAVEDYIGGTARKLTLIAASAVVYTMMAAGLFALAKLAL
ncbi:succinate dehydrogenase, hydrophobic membrane anchor protein [Aliiroseovarius sp. PTFE2010]|uniref:succinate dehydrogenase, hydrophobic membrane anchor protein n=1 Tax=Aliiroseovarius sp. PTFE2010 TaxID=3417190 RepID=UPI003CF040F5